MHKILQFLKSPYPYYFKGKSYWMIAIILFSMSLFFNYLFEPFEVNRSEHYYNFFWISFAHSFTALLIYFIYFGISGFFIQEDTWKIWKEILLIIGFFFLVGIGQFLIRDLIYDNNLNWSWGYLLEEIRNTFLVGTLFWMILLPLNFYRLYREHLNTAKHYKQKQPLQGKSFEQINISILTSQRSDDFTLNVKDLLFVKSEGNYLEFWLEDEQMPKKLIKRMTLKDLDSQLKDFPFFVKTHRSFLVNIHQVRDVKGNAQGYQLYFDKVPDPIPVARGNLATFERRMEGIPSL